MKVIVTRPRAQAQLLAERIAALGHEVVSCPLIEIVHISDDPIECGGYAWVIVTSPNGADEVARRARNLPKVAAVGPGTAETLRSHGIEPALVASVSTADGLAAELGRPEGRVLYLAAEEARRAPIEALGADYLPLYATVPLSPDPPEGDVVVLASGSAARAYAAIGGQAPVISIGPETTRIALSSGLTVAVEAKAHDLDGLVDAVAEFAAR
jgi:uroporphyrinogen III methyltransferase/synthase